MKIDPSFFEQILSGLSDCVTIQDREFRIIYQNASFRNSFGSHIGETCYSVYEKKGKICAGCGLQEVFKTGQPTVVVRSITERDTSTSYWENSCFSLFDAAGEVVAGVEICRNITEQFALENQVKKRNRELEQLNRKLRAISNCNQVLLRAETEQQLLDDVCRIICEEAGYLLAWVGFTEEDEEKTIRPMAWAGNDSSYVADIRVSWAEDDPHGKGPAGIAIRTGEPTHSQDIASDRCMQPWREDALRRGYRAGMALPLKDSAGKVFGVLMVYYGEANSITRDETELLQELTGDLAFGVSVLRERSAREEAQRQISLLSFAMDNVHEGAFLIDREARFHYVNDEACRSLGYNRDELLGRRIYDIDPNYTPEQFEKSVAERKHTGSRTFESHHKSKDGRIFPVEIYSNSLLFEGEEFSLAMVRDISERKQAEDERNTNLHFFESMDRVNRAIQGTNDLEQMMSTVLDEVLEIFASDRTSLIFPCDPEATSWKVPMERFRPEHPGVFALKTEMPMTPEIAEMHQGSRNSKRPVLFGAGTDLPLPEQLLKFGDKSGIGMAIYPKTGNAWGFSITQCSQPRTWTQKEIQLFEAIGHRLADGLTGLLSYRDLDEKREFLNNIIENLPNMLFVKDAKSLNFVRFNKAGEQLLGYHRDDLLGHNDYDFFPTETADFFTANDRRVLKAQRPIDIPEEIIRVKSGEERILHTRKVPLLDKNGEPQYLLGISEDITEHIKTETELRKLTQAIEQSPASIVITDAKGQIEFVNQRFTEITGYSSAESLGKNPRILKTGETSDETYQQLWQTISTGGTWSGEFLNQKKSGELFWEHATIAPIRDSQQKITHYVAVKEDITDRKRLEDQLQQAQKLESVGQLAGGVAHDFNNMLSIILGRTQMALQKVSPKDPLFTGIQEIHQAAERSADLTRQLLAFARKQVISPQTIDLNETLTGMLKMLRRLIGEDIELAWIPTDKPLSISMDPSQLDQILVNLCVNARDAIDGVGRITIETQQAIIDEHYCAEHTQATPGEYILLVVSDDGQGIDRGTLEHIFEPFFTTKGIGSGTGLGLATVYGIVKQNNGFINVDSESSQGTVFKIYLPRLTDDLLADQGETLEKPVANGTETILVVEDEPGILSITKLMLESCGYQIITAETPAKAIALAKACPDEIQLLISDVVMPDMNGPELMQQLTNYIPHIRCLYMSGYTANVILRHGVLEEGLHFLQKPFTLEALAEKVREILDQ